MMKTIEFEKQFEKKIEKIIDGIGSPYGEGATYESGHKPSQLEDIDKPALRKDIKKLISQAIEEERKRIIELVEDKYIGEDLQYWEWEEEFEDNIELLCLPNLYRINNDDEFVPCDKEVIFSVKNLLRNAIQEAVQAERERCEKHFRNEIEINKKERNR